MQTPTRHTQEAPITEHLPGKLSALEARMAIHIPPGGNWEDIPEDIPSDRLAQIRRMSRERGRCRTTYYGRLHPDRPAYTVNTWFSRIGNGTFLHYDVQQKRLITQREGARLQSFPDSYRFLGTHSSRFRQIGNAVPPFLAFCLVRGQLKDAKAVDLFCGAGGLSWGCASSGVEIVCAVDSDKHAMQTYQLNHPHAQTIAADLRSDDVKHEVITSGRGADLVLGGPPCQGFSQAGWFRAGDRRNFLFRDFLEVVRDISPSHFIMENVMGIRWTDKGRALQTILAAFRDIDYSVEHFVLSAERYGVPQVRRRVFVVGARSATPLQPPEALCGDASLFLYPVITVGEAISDLPPIEDGRAEYDQYLTAPQNAYQEFMRDRITSEEYHEILRRGGVQ